MFEGIQGLRAAAALAVAVLHICNEAGAFVGTPEISPWRWTDHVPLGAGVDLFFVISGFVMAWTCWNAWGRPGAALDFAAKRLRRIVPLYWLLTAATLAAAAAAPRLVSEGLREGWAYIAASVLFIPWRRLDGTIQPLLRLGWTLEYEMAFYALLAFSLPLRRAVALPAVAAGLVGLSLLHGRVAAGPAALSFWTDPIVLEFALGLLVGALARRGWRGGWAAFAAALLVAGLAAAAPAAPHWITIGIPCALLVGAALSITRLPAAIVLLGDASYALYLAHPFPMRALDLAFRRLGLPVGGYVAAAIAASVALAIALHLWVERPILRLGRGPRPVAAR